MPLNDKIVPEVDFSVNDIIKAEELLSGWIVRKNRVVSEFGESVASAVKWILLLWRDVGTKAYGRTGLISELKNSVYLVPDWTGTARVEFARRVFFALSAKPTGVPEWTEHSEIFFGWENDPVTVAVLSTGTIDRENFFHNFGTYLYYAVFSEWKHVEEGILRWIVSYLYRNWVMSDGIFRIMTSLRESAIRTHYGSRSKEITEKFITVTETLLLAHSSIADEDRRKSAENARKTAILENDERMYIEALHRSAIVQEVGLKGEILYANELTEIVTGWRAEEIVGQNVRIMKSWVHSQEFWSNLWRTVKSGQIWDGDICNKKRDRTFYWTHTTIVPFLDVLWNVTKFVCVRHDITEQKRMNEELQSRQEELASLHDELLKKSEELERVVKTDVLTKLGNRVAFESSIKSELARAARWTPLSVIMFDIDHFKKINDAQGHKWWDDALRRFGSVVRSILRSTDGAFRIWGEEFVLLLPDTQWYDAFLCAERIRTSLESKGWFTVSAGVTQYIPGDTQDIIVKRSDELMYAAKNSGRNRTMTDTHW